MLKTTGSEEGGIVKEKLHLELGSCSDLSPVEARASLAWGGSGNCAAAGVSSGIYVPVASLHGSLSPVSQGASENLELLQDLSCFVDSTLQH